MRSKNIKDEQLHNLQLFISYVRNILPEGKWQEERNV